LGGDIEQFVRETDLVGDMQLTREAVPSADHPHEIGQPAMLIDSPEQVLPATSDLHVCLIHLPGGRVVALVPPDSFPKLRSIALDPKKKRRGVNVYAMLLHHFCQIPIADPVLAVPADTKQNDLDRETAALEYGQNSSLAAPD